MNSSIINAATSMHAMQRKLDVIADNIANLNTAGYKRKTATFEELLTSLKRQDERFAQDGRRTPLGFTIGWGVRMTQVQHDMTQGNIQSTDNPFDLAIMGNALFEVVTNADGARAYTRNGAFQATINAAGDIVVTTVEGYPVVVRDEDGAEGPLLLPAGYNLLVDEAGRVSAMSPDGSDIVPLGRLKLVEPTRPDALQLVSDNLYVVREDVDAAEVLRDIAPGTDSDVRLAQGALEQSNAALETEMTELIMVQRAYQLSARALASADTMMSLANQLRA
jgi:flagellar basal-body rod protein FlgG